MSGMGTCAFFAYNNVFLTFDPLEWGKSVTLSAFIRLII